MRLIHIRIIGVLLLCVILYVKNWSLMPYWSAMILSLEILNRHERYRSQRFLGLYNWIFVGYLILVVTDRTRRFHVALSIEWTFNSVMHILFGLVVCFKISQYLTVFDIKINKRLLYIALIFNVIGILNEFLQNVMSQRETFVLIPDAQKDLVMNVIGTMVFMGVEILINRRK